MLITCIFYCKSAGPFGGHIIQSATTIYMKNICKGILEIKFGVNLLAGCRDIDLRLNDWQRRRLQQTTDSKVCWPIIRLRTFSSCVLISYKNKEIEPFHCKSIAISRGHNFNVNRQNRRVLLNFHDFTSNLLVWIFHNGMISNEDSVLLTSDPDKMPSIQNWCLYCVKTARLCPRDFTNTNKM